MYVAHSTPDTIIMIIYKITNIVNNKIYIDKTKNYKINYFGSGILIKRAIEKYGIKCFTKEIIDSTKTIKELNKKEQFWIKYYNSTNLIIGYNIGKGGNGGDIFTNNPNKEQIRKNCSHPGKANGMFGRKHSKETRRKISLHKKGQRAGIPTWNKGIKIREYSEGYRKSFLLGGKGSKNARAKLFIFISPQNKKFKVLGEFYSFCIKNGIDGFSARNFINKGRIPPPQKGTPKKERVNLIGWKIIRKNTKTK